MTCKTVIVQRKIWYADRNYLEKFFRNLILGENNELKNRYLLIGADLSTTEKIGDKLTRKARMKYSEMGKLM